MKLELNAEAPSSAKQSQMWLKLEGWTLHNNNTVQISKECLTFLSEKLETVCRVQASEHYIVLKPILDTSRPVSHVMGILGKMRKAFFLVVQKNTTKRELWGQVYSSYGKNCHPHSRQMWVRVCVQQKCNRSYHSIWNAELSSLLKVVSAIEGRVWKHTVNIILLFLVLSFVTSLCSFLKSKNFFFKLIAIEESTKWISDLNKKFKDYSSTTKGTLPFRGYLCNKYK